MPAWIFSSTRRSKAARTSSSRSRSTRSRWGRFRQTFVIRDITGTLGLPHAGMGSCFQRTSHREGNSVPLHRFLPQLSSSRPAECVVLRATVVFGRLPDRRQPACLLESVQGGKERPRLHDERPVRYLFDAARNAEAVELSGRECLENQ